MNHVVGFAGVVVLLLASLGLQSHTVVYVAHTLLALDITPAQGAGYVLLSMILTHQAIPTPENGSEEAIRYGKLILMRMFLTPVFVAALAYIVNFFV